MKRYPDWMMRWDAFVTSRLAVPFAWGVNDCGLFMGDAVEALTGERVCPDLRWHRNVREALRILEQVGGPRGVAERAFGASVKPKLARVGDVVLVPVGKRELLAMCNGQTVIGPTRDGLREVPLRFASEAWRVG